jgi:hypothetical protein
VDEMNKKDFNELKESIIEAGLVMQGKQKASREFYLEKPPKSNPNTASEYFAVCITDEDDDLTPMQIYKVRFDVEHNNVIVKDDNNETFFCPASYFTPIEVPEKATKFLATHKELSFA